MSNYSSTSKVKRWTLQGLLVASAAGLGVAGVLTQLDQGNPVEAAEAGESIKEGLPLSVYDNAMQVRRNTGLSDKDLAALGLDQAEATAVLGRLVDWCQTNEAALHRSRQAIHGAERELDEQQRLIRTGRASERQLSDTEKAQAVEQAKQAYAALMKSGASHAMQAGALGSGKSAAWQQMVEIAGQPGSELRYLPGMTQARQMDLSAQSRRQGVGVDHLVTYNEQMQLQQIRQRISSHQQGVRAAVEVAMPLPQELRAGPEVLAE